MDHTGTFSDTNMSNTILVILIVFQVSCCIPTVEPMLSWFRRSTSNAKETLNDTVNRNWVLQFLKENPCSKKSTLAMNIKNWRCREAVKAFNRLPAPERTRCPETSNARCLDDENCVVDLPKPGDPDGRTLETLKNCAQALRGYQSAQGKFKERPGLPFYRSGRSRTRTPPPGAHKHRRGVPTGNVA